MDNFLLKKLLTEYDAKRIKAISDADLKKQEIYNSIPELQNINKELHNLSIKTLKSVLISSPIEKENYIKNLEEKSNNLIIDKCNILKKHGILSDDLEPNFECPICKDTGYINNNICNCLKQKIYNIQYNKSNISNLEKENFDTFNFNIYSNEINKDLYSSDISPRENIKKIYNAAIHFVDNFNNSEEKNLMFLGPTGLGKTFLSNCIAKSLLEKGKTVLYQTAPIMLDTIISSRFNKQSDNNFMDNLLNVDLLIIDDLGTETINSMKYTELFTIINTRLLNQSQKITKTIISTNLDLKTIFSVYNERIASRIIGNYNIYKFFGDDIRLKIKK